MWTWSPECAPPLRSCWHGVLRSYEDAAGELEGLDIVGEIYPEPQDLIVEKDGYNAFHLTELDDALRANHVTDLVVVGTSASRTRCTARSTRAIGPGSSQTPFHRSTTSSTEPRCATSS